MENGVLLTFVFKELVVGLLVCNVMGIRSHQVWMLLLTHILMWHDGSVENGSSSVNIQVVLLMHCVPNRREEKNIKNQMLLQLLR